MPNWNLEFFISIKIYFINNKIIDIYIYIMSDAFLTNAAISQGNALTRDAMEHNDAVKARNQEILSQVNREKNTLDGQERTEKLFHDISDTYNIGGALKSDYNTYNEEQKVGGFKNYIQGEGGIGTLKKRVNTMKNFVQGKINEATTQAGKNVSEAVQNVKPQATPLNDAANPNGTAAEGPVEPADRPPAPAAKAGTAASTAGSEAEGLASKIPKSTDELFQAARDTAGKAGDALGVVGMGMGVVAGGQALAEDIMDPSKFDSENTADKISNVASIAAGALDVASIFLPVLAPAAAIASATAAVSGGVGEIEDIADRESKDASDANAMKGTQQAATDLAAGGMVASTSTDTTKSISATGSF